MLQAAELPAAGATAGLAPPISRAWIAMADPADASHGALLGELSGRDRVDAVLARLEATYVQPHVQSSITICVIWFLHVHDS